MPIHLLILAVGLLVATATLQRSAQAQTRPVGVEAPSGDFLAYRARRPGFRRAPAGVAAGQPGFSGAFSASAARRNLGY